LWSQKTAVLILVSGVNLDLHTIVGA